jgi:hypothetical protein
MSNAKLSKHLEQEEEGEYQINPAVDLRDVFPSLRNKTPAQVGEDVFRATFPNLSITFFTFFVIVTYFHNDYPWIVGVFMSMWTALQVFDYVTNEDFQSDLFWNWFSLAGNAIFYLILGLAWSFVKLYLDVWQKQLPAPLLKSIATCFASSSSSCAFDILSGMKWRIMYSLMSWPMSIAFTLCRDPLNIFTGVIFDTFVGYYGKILQRAFLA